MSSHSVRFAVLDIDGAQIDLLAACEWYRALSRGALALSVGMRRGLRTEHAAEEFAVSGGMGRAPLNSQALAAEALSALGAVERDQLARPDTHLVLAVPACFRAHTWRLRGGGFALGGGAWCRRYAILPQGASLGAIVHELGHLLFEWPDFRASSRLGQDCLMAQGGYRAGGRDPSPPCAPLLLERGWRARLELTSDTRVVDLARDRVGVFAWQGRELAIELRDEPGRRRLLVMHDERESANQVRLIARAAVGDADMQRRVLAVIASDLGAVDVLAR